MRIVSTADVPLEDLRKLSAELGPDFHVEVDEHQMLFKSGAACPYQKLSWPTLSELSCTQPPDVPDQTSRGRASFHKNSTSHGKRAHVSLCIFTRALGSLFRSGMLTRVKMMQAADFWNLDYMTE